jgi:hypothetical protein
MALILRSCRRRAAAAACLALYALNLWGAHRLLGGIEPRPRQRQQQPQDNELDPLQMHMNRNRRPPPFFPAREMPPRQHQQRQQEQPAIGTGAPPHDMITTLDALDSTRYDYPPLDCGRLSGGRSREDEASREMVYWKARAGEAAAPAAAASEGAAVRASPPARYLTFEPDPAGTCCVSVSGRSAQLPLTRRDGLAGAGTLLLTGSLPGYRRQSDALPSPFFDRLQQPEDGDGDRRRAGGRHPPDSRAAPEGEGGRPNGGGV